MQSSLFHNWWMVVPFIGIKIQDVGKVLEIKQKSNNMLHIKNSKFEISLGANSLGSLSDPLIFFLLSTWEKHSLS